MNNSNSINSINNLHCIIPDRLYYTNNSSPPSSFSKSSSSSLSASSSVSCNEEWFSIDNILHYEPFFSDFGKFH